MDLNNADIKSLSFKNKNLTGANFHNSKAGLNSVFAGLVLNVSFFCSILAATVFQRGTASVISDFSSRPIHNATILVLLSVFFIVTIYRGIVISTITSISITILVILFSLGTGVVKSGSVTAELLAGSVAGVITIIVVSLGIVTISIAATVAVTATKIWAISGVVISAMVGVGVSASIHTSNTEAAFASIISASAIFISAYIAIKALAGDRASNFISQISIVLAAFGGTSFRFANLTEVNFTEAILKNTDFRDADLTRVCWKDAKWLELARLENTYLANPKIRRLVVTLKGQTQNLDGLNMEGVNLKTANLQDASFVRANLNHANLQNVNLSGAKLKQAQLNGADLTGATLTGAYIEDWGITGTTQLDDVQCDYIFMRLPTPDDPNPHRKPDNWNETFADGDFADFIKPIVDTLDLYHNSDVDPRAIAISFKQLAENHPDAELEIVAMEKRGQDKFLLRAKTAPTSDKSELSAEYFTIYNELKALAKQELKALMEEKDSRISSLETMVKTALQGSKFYVETYHNQGNTMGNRNINMGDGNYNERIEGNYVQGDYREGKQSHFNLQGAQFGGGLVNADTVNAHQIGGNITNYTYKQKQNPELVKTILILAANPKTTTALRLDEEVREIDAGLQRAKKRDQFDLKQRWAVRIQDVYQSLLDFKPQIVHFSGHGTGDDGLVLEDETGNVRLVETVALAGLFELFVNTIECVVLNACYSQVQASAIASHIPYVIGMKKEVGDKVAIKFATGFYSALGAGESVEFAYKLGCSVIQLDGIAEHLTPVLKKK